MPVGWPGLSRRWVPAVVLSMVLAMASSGFAGNGGRGGPSQDAALDHRSLEISVLEVAILDSINVQRRSHGLEPLLWDATLADIARRTGQDLIRRRRLDHIDLEGRGPSDRIARQHRRLIGLVGENLAAFSGHWPESPQALAAELVSGWMGSPGHRRNILRVDYNYSGVGLVMRGRELRCVQLFAAVEAFLTTALPPSLKVGSRWPLSFVEGIGRRPEGVSLQPLGNPRRQERRQSPDFVEPADFRVEVTPGAYRLRFYFRESERRFSVIDGPQLEVERLAAAPP